MWHRETKSAHVSDKTLGAGNSALNDRGGGVLGSEMEDFVLEFTNGILLVGGLLEHFVDCGSGQALGNVICKAFFGEGLYNCEH